MKENVQLPAHIHAEIIAHAREGKPEEICGILRGRGLVATELIRARNIAEERIENYTIDPQTLLLQYKFEAEGDAMMGVYHSHPVSVAYPSATDARWSAIYPDCVYLICSLEFDDAPVIRAFRMRPEEVELDIATLRGHVDFREVRANLFGYYQPADTVPPPVLSASIGELAPPFYVVYATEGDRVVEGYVVAVEEYVIEVV
jgi:proteasome lid subunit RPN8/RPN11